MRKYLQVISAVAVIVFVLVSAMPNEATDIGATDIYEPEPLSELLRIGVTATHFDNVGQILRHFGDGAEISILTREDMTNIERLSAFYAIFINCGSHGAFDSRVLNTFVSQGGVVYASDHAGSTIKAAFPGKIDFFRSTPSQLVRDSEIVHSTLASHMRMDSMDILFDLGGWFSITELSDCAIVYIQGELADGEVTPLAISFAYGEGQVFFTSFHNSAQASFHMINFIEYLVFRIKNVEADRTLQQAAEDEGFIYRGAVFGGAGSVAMAIAPPSLDMAEEMPTAWFGEWSDFYSIDSEDDGMNLFSPGAVQDVASAPSAPALWEEYFRYNFQGQGFMLLFGEGNAFYYVTLIDPNNNRFTIHYDGTVETDISSNAAQPVITLEYVNGYRVRVMDITQGEWRFSATPRDGSDIMIGIAVME